MIIDGVRINYGVLDQTIEEDAITDMTSGDSDYSDAQKTLDTAITYDKITYLEKDYFLLDGSHVFPETGNTYNVGWESASISDTSGAVDEYIEFTFQNLHGSYGIQLQFPDDCPADTFTIAYYNDDELVGTRTVTGNTKTAYSNSDVRLNWNRVLLTFTKVNPQQRARLWGVSFGVNEFYDEDMLASVSASRATDFTGDYDNSGEFSFQFFNNGRFNVNFTDEFPIGLQEGLTVKIYIRKRGDTAYTLFGTYFSETTEVQDNGQVITVSGYDPLYQLDTSTYKNGIVYPNGRSLAAWAQEIADDAGITIEIDSAFESIISTGYIGAVPHREALRLIAEAGNGILISKPNGTIALKIHTPVSNGTLTADDIVDGTYTTENEDKILGVSVTRYSFNASGEVMALGSLEDFTLSEATETIEIQYSTMPVVESSVNVSITSGTAQITETKAYADRCIITLVGAVGTAVSLNITGIIYNIAESSITEGSTAKNIKTISGNYLITGSIAQSVAIHQYNRVANKYTHSMEVVKDTVYELGDEIIVNTGDASASGKAQYVDNISFEIDSENNTMILETVDE